MAKAKNVLSPHLDTQIQALLETLNRTEPAVTLDERKTVLELAMKYETLKLRAKSDNHGKFFENNGGDEDDDTKSW